MIKDKDVIACDICGSRFDSACNRFCKPCEYYNDGLKKFGKTKSNEEYELEMLIEIAKTL